MVRRILLIHTRLVHQHLLLLMVLQSVCVVLTWSTQTQIEYTGIDESFGQVASHSRFSHILRIWVPFVHLYLIFHLKFSDSLGELVIRVDKFWWVRPFRDLFQKSLLFHHKLVLVRILFATLNHYSLTILYSNTCYTCTRTSPLFHRSLLAISWTHFTDPRIV